MEISLRDIAYARSGDKGAHANIGVIAYTETGYTCLVDFLTASQVKEFFISLKCQDVVRYELPNLLALNFLLKGALGKNGGSLSPRFDAQGKALGQALLSMKINIPDDQLSS